MLDSVKCKKLNFCKFCPIYSILDKIQIPNEAKIKDSKATAGLWILGILIIISFVQIGWTLQYKDNLINNFATISTKLSVRPLACTLLPRERTQ
jgi:hypothetical protein